MANVDAPLAIVTGANGGLGRGFVEEFGLDHRILGVASNEASAAELEEFLQARGIDGIASVLDLSRPELIGEWYEEMTSEQGDPTLVINNAGVTKDGLFARQHPKDIRTALAVNLESPMVLMSLAARGIRRADGAILNVSSISGSLVNPGQVIYGTTKAGLNQATRVVAAELKVRANALAPGVVDTEMWHAVPEKTRLAVLARTRSGEALSVSAVVKAARRIVASDITGKVIHLNDGLYDPASDDSHILFEDLAA